MTSICMMLVAASLAVSAQNTTMLGNAESRILLLEHAWNKAERRRDIQALDQLLAGTFTYADNDGSFYTKAQFLESIRNAAEAIEQLVNEQGNARI